MAHIFKKVLGLLLPFIFIQVVHATPIENATFRVFCGAQVAPFSFINKNWQQPEGFEVDLFYEIQKRLGFKIQENRIIPIPQDLLGDFIDNGKADICFGAIASTYEREKKFNISNVYAHSSLGILKRSDDNSISNMSSLYGKKIVLVQDSDGMRYTQSVLKGKSELIIIPNLTIGLFMVRNGKADAIIYDRYILSYFVDTTKDLLLSVTSDAFNMDAGRMAMLFSKDFLYKDEINNTIAALIADGTVDKLIRKWRTKSSY